MAPHRARYPLQAAHTLRRAAVLSARERAARAELAYRRCLAQLQRAEAREAAHQANGEPSRLQVGAVSAATLQRHVAYRARYARRGEQLGHATRIARRALDQARAELHRARLALARARNDEAHVARHRQRFFAAQRRHMVEEEQRETDAQWLARQVGASRRRRDLA